MEILLPKPSDKYIPDPAVDAWIACMAAAGLLQSRPGDPSLLDGIKDD